MKRLRMIEENKKTFEDVCNMYIDYCKQRNLREATIKHYKQSYNQFYKYFDKDMPISKLDAAAYAGYVKYLFDTLENDVSINAYLRDMITTLHYAMNEGILERYKMTSIKVDKTAIQTYSDEELKLLLKKPDLKKCSFSEYQSWVITNFLFSTGVRQHSLMELQVRDLDLDNKTVNLRITKNRKTLLIPINLSLVKILKEFLKYRQPKDSNDWLFCNAYGQKLCKSTSYHFLYEYNKKRGVQTTGIHRYRHTFAKQWVLNGGNVVVLSRLLGHSSLQITQNYINLLVSDLAKEVEEINVLKKFQERKSIKMEK